MAHARAGAPALTFIMTGRAEGSREPYLFIYFYLLLLGNLRIEFYINTYIRYKQ